MDRTESIVRNMLAAIEAPLYDVGVLNDRGMLPGLDGIPPLWCSNASRSSNTAMPAARTSTSALRASIASPCSTIWTRPHSRDFRQTASFLAPWSRPAVELSSLAQTRDSLPQASRHLRRPDSGISIRCRPECSDWRRFGRLPGFTNCKPKYRKPEGLFPFVRLKSHTGE